MRPGSRAHVGRTRSRSSRRQTRAGPHQDRLTGARRRRGASLPWASRGPPLLTGSVGIRTVRLMPPLEALGPSIGIGLVLLVMLWFALGTQRNIRKGNAVLAWLQGGLPILGRRTTVRWLGSSAVELG